MPLWGFVSSPTKDIEGAFLLKRSNSGNLVIRTSGLARCIFKGVDVSQKTIKFLVGAKPENLKSDHELYSLIPTEKQVK